MSLDQNLFTLVVKPHEENPEVLDLVDPKGVLHYRKQRAVEATEYKIEVYDPLSESLLSTVTAPSVSSKHKTIELHNPTVAIELKYTGRLAFKWSFKWEEHEFEWKREECYMLRKPDPPVLVAVTKEPQGKIKTTSIQILDYNLRRFEIDDRRGLEIVILTALLSFSDTDDINRKPSSGPGLSRQPSALANTIAPSDQAPELPPRPPAKTGIDRIVEKQAIVGEINEVTVDDEGTVEEYGKHCAGLLEEDAMLFITVRSADAQFVSKVLQVIEETKRIRHKSGLDQDEELHQYVVHEPTATASPSAQKGKGPRIINLDDDPKDKAKNKATDKSKAPVNDYTPPTSLAVHLSKIPMPELQPKKTHSMSSSPPKKKEKETKPSKNTKEDDRLAASSSKPLKPKSPARVKPHEVHPHQPSPSPAQLNNPLIYAAPPPPPRSSRPPPNQAMPTPAHFRVSNNNNHVGNQNFRQPPTSEGPSSSLYGGSSAAYTMGMPMPSSPPPPPSNGEQRPASGSRVSSFATPTSARICQRTSFFICIHTLMNTLLSTIYCARQRCRCCCRDPGPVLVVDDCLIVIARTVASSRHA